MHVELGTDEAGQQQIERAASNAWRALLGDDEIWLGREAASLRRSSHGHWSRVPRADIAPAYASPFWLLEALLGVTEARRSEDGRGDSGGHLRCRVDLIEADDRSAYGLAAPHVPSARALRDARFEIALDAESRISSVAWLGPLSMTTLTLHDFNAVPRIELPLLEGSGPRG